jgi:hypothetical protein
VPRSYPYGKVPTSIGIVVTEKVEKPLVCCGYASAQMVARTARAGVGTNLKTEGHRIRSLGGRPHWNGSNAGELRAGLSKALGVKVTGITKGAVLSRVKQGFGVTISIQYIKLPSYLKVQTNDFGHSVMLRGYRSEGGYDLVGYFDPLYEQGAQGSWARWVDIDQALWDGGHNTATTKWVPPTPPPVTPPTGSSTEDDYVTTPAIPKQLDVPSGKWLYIHSDFRTDPGNVQISPARQMPLAGFTAKGDYAVGYEPASNVPTNLKVMYVKKADATVIGYPPPPASGPTPDQVLAIRKAEYKRVTDGSIIQPPKAPG